MTTNHEPPAGVSGQLDDKAFEELFREYFSDLTLFALKYTGDADSAKEIVHTVFVNLWEKRERIDADTSLRSYLFTSVYNRCLNHLRDQRKFKKDALFDVTVEMAAADDAAAGIETSELSGRIEEGLDRLPEKCRQVFELNRFEGLKYREISEKLGISVKTVEAQMTKALRILREHLKDYFFWYLLAGSAFLRIWYQGMG